MIETLVGYTILTDKELEAIQKVFTTFSTCGDINCFKCPFNDANGCIIARLRKVEAKQKIIRSELGISSIVGGKHDER